MKLCEWVEANDDARLLVLIETEDGQCARLLCRELQEMGEINCSEQQGGAWQLGLLAQCGVKFDVCLTAVQEKLDSVNSRWESAPAELVETRLVSGSTASLAAAPVTIGSFTLVSQTKKECRSHEIRFDGGKAFGSGSHPSTRLAVSLLEAAADQLLPVAVLDVGCGSGVLSLISARLGSRRTVGVDICSDSLAVARYNVEQNNLCDRITIIDTPVQDIAGPFDLIMANLTLSVLYRLQADFRRLCRFGGFLIVSGLQGQQPEDVLPRLQESGWQLEKRVCEGKWQAMLLRRLSLNNAGNSRLA
ncbi:MAG: 50S ribosomal protein L11 methyltransferase [Proteobacteria bacterium]|nr:50S ribosomal protein L11 methyltransferase [Pseudomonadota bacterium]MBU4295231.1 50S ribosomal protein L11 methyltransferase [Pseudomonadota bacterium]MCG2750165.1 50S ribosomal protein L11 methyltransferase [Desulfobulbaceae bacterium]